MYKSRFAGGRWLRQSRLKDYLDIPKRTTAQLSSKGTTSGFGRLGTEAMIVYDETTNTVKFNNGSDWIEFAASTTTTLDASYNADTGERTITVDDGDIVFDLNDNSNDYTIVINNTTAGTIAEGLVIDAEASSSVFDDGIKIITTAGAITDGLDVSDAGLVNAVNLGAGNLAGTTATIGFSVFDVDANGNVTCNDLTVGGTYAPATISCTTLTATNATITNLTLTSVDGFNLAGDCVFTTAATTGNGLLLDGSTVTTGDILQIEADATKMASGLILNCTVDTSTVFSVAENGALSVAGTAAGSDAINITAGDVTLVAGHIVQTLGNNTLTNGNLALAAGGLDVTAGSGDGDAFDLIPITTGAAIDINLPGSYNLSSGAIDIDGSTGTGPVIEIAASSTYTGDFISLNMTNAVGAKAIDITGAGTRVVSLVHLTDTPTHASGHTIDIDVTPGALTLQVIDIDVAGTDDADIICMNFAEAYTGSALIFDMTTAVGAIGIELIGAGTRVVPMVSITDTPATSGSTLDLNIDPAAGCTQAIDIDIAGTDDCDIICMNFSEAYTGSALKFDMSTAVAAIAMELVGAGNRTVPLISILDTPQTSGSTMDIDVTPAAGCDDIIDIDITGTDDATVMSFAFAGLYTGTALEILMDNTVAAQALVITGTGTRTVDLINITDTPSTKATINLDVTPAASQAGANVLDIDVGSSTGNADVMSINFAGAYVGDAINVTTTNMGAAGQALVIDGSLAASGNIVDVSTSGILAGGTGRVVKLGSSGQAAVATAGLVLQVFEEGGGRATSYAANIKSTSNEALLIDVGKSRFDEEVTFKASNRHFYCANYVSATGANNAIVVALTDSDGSNVTLAEGLELHIDTGAYTLNAGANTLTFNGVTDDIKQHTDAANIADDYSANSIVHVIFDGTQWLDMSQ